MPPQLISFRLGREGKKEKRRQRERRDIKKEEKRERGMPLSSFFSLKWEIEVPARKIGVESGQTLFFDGVIFRHTLGNILTIWDTENCSYG